MNYQVVRFFSSKTVNQGTDCSLYIYERNNMSHKQYVWAKSMLKCSIYTVFCVCFVCAGNPFCGQGKYSESWHLIHEKLWIPL